MSEPAFYDSYIKPFRLLEALKLECGYEKSFKLMRGHFLPNRYLLGIDKSRLNRSTLRLICESMGMPQRFVDDLFEHYNAANLVLLGFEEGAEGCTYRIYLEYWDKIRAAIAGKSPPHEPMTMFQGFKWNALDNSRAVLTEYTCYPKLETDQIIEKVDALLSAREDSPVFEISRDMIQAASQRAGGQTFIYLEASEAGNPRQSFDINLYSADMTLESVSSQLLQLCHHYEIDRRELEVIYRRDGSRPLGHISAGLDRDANDFFTVYYES